MRVIAAVIVIVLGITGLSAFGEEIQAVSPPVPDNVASAKDNVPDVSPPPSDNVVSETGFAPPGRGRIDRSHAYVNLKINGMVSWFDGLFGETTRADPSMTENYIRWGNELRWEDGTGVRYKPSLRARILLPKFGKKARLVIIEENREAAVAPVPSEPGTPVVNKPTQGNSMRAVNTEFRFYTHDTLAGYAFFAAGSRFVWPPETFVRARFLRRFIPEDNSFISPSVTPFWQDRIGFGVTPQLDFGYPVARDRLFLWTSSATIYDKRAGVLWGTELSLTRILSPKSAVALAVGANGSTRHTLVMDNYKMASNSYLIALRYRRKIFKPWLFLEVTPESRWRKYQDGVREFVPAFTVRLEVSTEGARALLPVPLVVKEHIPVR